MKCPICQNSKISDLPQIAQYHFCANCKTAWRKKFEKVEYSKEYYSGKSGFIKKTVEPIFALFYLIRRMYAPEKVRSWIDVGAGDGDFLKTVKASNRIGVEISPSGRAKMKSLGLAVLTNQQFLNPKSKNADVISFWHVLEHLEKPREYLKSACNNLSKGGKLIVAVPNIDSLEFKFFGKFWFNLEPKFHQWQFSINSMKLLLKQENFKVESEDYISPEHQFAGLLQSFINITSGTENVLHSLVKRNVKGKISAKGLIWSLFWMTLGLPIVLTFWLLEILLKKPGTFVMTASKKRTTPLSSST